MLSDLWALVRPALRIVAQHDSPPIGTDLLRDWLGLAAPGWSIFFSILLFFNVRARTAYDTVLALH